jgi:hypothetical protein
MYFIYLQLPTLPMINLSINQLAVAVISNFIGTISRGIVCFFQFGNLFVVFGVLVSELGVHVGELRFLRLKGGDHFLELGILFLKLHDLFLELGVLFQKLNSLFLELNLFVIDFGLLFFELGILFPKHVIFVCRSCV